MGASRRNIRTHIRPGSPRASWKRWQLSQLWGAKEDLAYGLGSKGAEALGIHLGLRLVQDTCTVGLAWLSSCLQGSEVRIGAWVGVGGNCERLYVGERWPQLRGCEDRKE